MFAYKILKAFLPRIPHDHYKSVYSFSESKARILKEFPNFETEISGKTVLDFACGLGHEAVTFAKLGATKIYGLDIREEVLEKARALSLSEGVSDQCIFTLNNKEVCADITVSLDAFEHFSEPEKMLKLMSSMTKADGKIYISFGPSWYHPRGGHLFSVFPWAHLLFSEAALIRWRADFKNDGATRFSEVAGGLNQIKIADFERMVKDSGLKIEHIEKVPIRALSWAANKCTEEFTTSVVRCVLRK